MEKIQILTSIWFLEIVGFRYWKSGRNPNSLSNKSGLLDDPGAIVAFTFSFRVIIFWKKTSNLTNELLLTIF